MLRTAIYNLKVWVLVTNEHFLCIPLRAPVLVLKERATLLTIAVHSAIQISYAGVVTNIANEATVSAHPFATPSTGKFVRSGAENVNQLVQNTVSELLQKQILICGHVSSGQINYP